jgi:hypothetical protein
MEQRWNRVSAEHGMGAAHLNVMLEHDFISGLVGGLEELPNFSADSNAGA